MPDPLVEAWLSIFAAALGWVGHPMLPPS